jgi:hypothetical protein
MSDLKNRTRIGNTVDIELVGTVQGTIQRNPYPDV